MSAFNKIRIGFEDERQNLKPLLRAAYQSIYDFQLHRTSENEAKMRKAIVETTVILNVFIDYIPPSKGKYILALQRQADMLAFDLVICFDQAIYELHLWMMLQELGIKRGKWSKHNKLPWSKELRRLLDERQHTVVSTDHGDKEELFLVSGTPACRGSAQGPSCIVRSIDDFHKVKSGNIVITEMTTPDFIMIAELISGIVADRGGVLCHAAILAREYNIPCIVGCVDATSTINEGQIIRMDAVSGVVVGV
jgi:phosphohistidine swiveling domain-containing protein